MRFFNLRITLVLFAFILLNGLNAQNTFRISYDVDPLYDMPGGILETTSGDYIFAGGVLTGEITEIDPAGVVNWSNIYTSGTTIFSDIVHSGTGYAIGGGAGGDVMLMETSSTGTIVWGRTYNPTNGSSASASQIKKLASGDYIIAGSVTGYDPDGAGPMAVRDSSNCYIIKTNSTGTIIWDKVILPTLAFDNDHYLYDVEEVTGGYIFVGSTSENGTDDNMDALIIKTDVNGNILSSQTFGDAGESEELMSINKLASGEVIVSGYDNDQAMVLRLDASANVTWGYEYVAGFLSTAVSQGYNAFETNDGKYACVGTYIDPVSFFNGTNGSLPTIGTFLFKIEPSNGSLIFQKFYQNGLSSLMPDGIQASDNGYLLTMMAQETSPLTGFNYHVVKTDQNGDLVANCDYQDLSLSNSGFTPSYTAVSPNVYSGTTSSTYVPVVSSTTPSVGATCCSVADPTTATATPSTICSGASTTITASGSASGVTYNVYDAATGGTLLGSTPYVVSPGSTTTYYIEAESAIGCTSTNRVSVTVTVVTAPTVSVSPTSSTICSGESIAITATPSGGSGSGYTYSWSNGGSTSSISPSPTSNTTYSVTVTDGAGCTSSSASSVITVNSPPTASISGPTTTCDNETITLTASGGDSYSWSSGENTASIDVSPNSSTTYTVTVGLTGCTVTDQASQTVTVNSSPTASITGNNTICDGASTTLTASGGTSYVWSTTATTTSVSVSPASNTTYSVIATGSNGCKDTTQYSVTVNALPTVTANASLSSICIGDPVTLTGSGANTYTWDNSVLDGVAITPASTTTYTVTGTDGNGCQNTDQVTVTVNTLPTVVANSTSSSVCLGSQVTLTGSGATTYSWNNSVLDGVAFAPSTTTTYTVTGTDGNGCENTDQVTITVNSLPAVVANASQTTICDGESVTLSGSGATTYSWDNSVTDGVSFTPSVTNTYEVTGTDGNGCQNTDQVTVTVNSLPTVTANASSSSICIGDPVTLTGAGANTYTWDNSVSDGVAFTPASTNTYTVTGTDGNGCQNTDQVTVTVNSLPTVVASASPSTTVCSGSSVTLTGSGANTYVWDNGVTDGVSFVPASTTPYTVTGTDGNGCQNTDVITVNVVAPPVATINGAVNGTVSACSNEVTTLTITPNGGTYLWSTGESTQSIDVMPGAATTYTATVTIGSCSDATDITINVNTSPTGSVSGTGNNQVCSGTNDTLTAMGGINYLWSTTETTSSIVVAPTVNSDYTVVVYDVNNCTDTLTYSVSVDPLPTITISGTDTICNGTSTILTANGASSYVWSTSETTSSIAVSPTLNTSYSVIGTDGNGCENTSVYNVVVLAPPSAGISGDTVTCPGQPITLTAAGGNSYVWNTGATTQIINDSPGATTTYTVVAFVGSCSDTAQLTVNVVPPPNVILGADTSIIIGQSFTLNATGASEYSWITPTDGIDINDLNSSNPTASPEESITYCVVGEQNGCLDTACIFVEVVVDCGDIFVPNAFSPNNDQNNDCLMVYSNCMESMTFRVFARWGEMVYETTEIDGCWDGTYKGQLLNTGTFAYILEYTLIDGTQGMLKGNVSLIK